MNNSMHSYNFVPFIRTCLIDGIVLLGIICSKQCVVVNYQTLTVSLKQAGLQGRSVMSLPARLCSELLGFAGTIGAWTQEK